MRRFFRLYKKVLIVILVLVLALIGALVISNVNDGIDVATDKVIDKIQSDSNEKELLKVHYFDVGQGDCEFIELPNGDNILIDAGEREYGQTVVDNIKDLGYTTVNYVIATHPHSDHIGGLIEVYNQLDIESTYLPNCTHTTKTYSDFMTCVENEKCKVVEAFNGVDMIKSDSINAYFIAPNSKEYEKINNYSACLKLDYYDNSFLFMGDAEQESEFEINSNVKCDVIKVGHHGSDTSSSYNFVSRTGAKYGVMEVGLNNDYGHPHEKTLNTWKENGTIIFRTDLNGNIVFISDGKNITYQCDKNFKSVEEMNEANPTTTEKKKKDSATTTTTSTGEYKWVLNTYRKKIHYPDCDSVSQMNPENREYSNESLSELYAKGYKGCGNCKPRE